MPTKRKTRTRTNVVPMTNAQIEEIMIVRLLELEWRMWNAHQLSCQSVIDEKAAQAALPVKIKPHRQDVISGGYARRVAQMALPYLERMHRQAKIEIDMTFDLAFLEAAGF